MVETFPTRLLMRVLQATPEQLSAIGSLLGECGMGNAECGMRKAEGGVDGVGNAEGGVRNADGRGGVARSRHVFRKTGSHWQVVFDWSEAFHLEDTLGARYLDYLLHHPNEAISAFDLEVAIRPERALARAKDSAMAALDPETVRSYLRELSRVRAEREAASDRGEFAEAERLDDEIAALEQALRSGAGSGDAGERARGNVSKAIAAVRRRLLRAEGAERAFGRHVGQLVNTGYQCIYNQPAGRIWS